MARQTELLQRPNAVPVHIHFIPAQAVPGGNRMGVMIVVPALAKGEKRHPPAVGGKVFGDEAARTPAMGCGVHQPGGVQADHGAHEDAPHQERQSADGQQDQSQHDHGNVVIFRDPDVEFIFGKIRDVAGQGGGVMVHGLADQDPAHVRPPFAVNRRMRVALLRRKIDDECGAWPPRKWGRLQAPVWRRR